MKLKDIGVAEGDRFVCDGMHLDKKTVANDGLALGRVPVMYSSPMPAPMLEEVFGIRTKPVLSYLTRPQVDGAFENALKTDHHIVIYGSSKQGKTALRQKHLKEEDQLLLRPTPRSSIDEMYLPMLRAAGVTVEVQAVDSVGSGTKTTGRGGFQFSIPLVGAGEAGLEVEGQSSKERETRRDFVGANLSDAQTVATFVKKAAPRKFVVVENFHYLPEEAQKQFAFDLKIFHELNLRFIILGTWREANRLLQFNGDLQGRVVEIPVEPWRDDDLKAVALKGAQCLNIQFEDGVVRELAANAYGSVGLFQEFLAAFCRTSGIDQAQVTKVVVSDAAVVAKALAECLDQQLPILRQNLVKIASASRTRDDTDQPLVLPYYLVAVALTVPFEQLRTGISKKSLLELIKKVHHRDDKTTIRVGDVTNLLNRLPQYQKDVVPPLFYFDHNASQLKVVDARQFFVFARANRAEMLEEIPNPIEE